MNKRTNRVENAFDTLINQIDNIVAGPFALIKLLIFLVIGVLLIIGCRSLVVFLLDTVGDAVFEWIISSPRILWGSMSLFGMFLLYLFIHSFSGIVNFIADIDPLDWFFLSGGKF